MKAKFIKMKKKIVKILSRDEILKIEKDNKPIKKIFHHYFSQFSLNSLHGYQFILFYTQ